VTTSSPSVDRHGIVRPVDPYSERCITIAEEIQRGGPATLLDLDRALALFDSALGFATRHRLGQGDLVRLLFTLLPLSDLVRAHCKTLQAEHDGTWRGTAA
jgi:hypothetical protein